MANQPKIFALNRPEGRWFEPARSIDPLYSDTLERAFEQGVEVLVLRLKHEDTRVSVGGTVHLSL